MRNVKRAKTAYICYSLALIIIGICLAIIPGISSKTLCVITGAFLIGIGAVKIMNYFVNDVYGLAFQFDLAMGMIDIILGIILILHPDSVLALLELILGVLFVVDGNFKLQTAVEAKRFGLSRWWTILIAALLTITAGLLLITNPLIGVLAMTVVLGISMVTDGILNLLVALYAIKLVKRLKE